MSSQSKKERKAKKSLTFERGIQGGMQRVLKVPYVTDYDPESKDYFILIKTNSASNSSSIEQNLSLKEYLDMIKPYLSYIIN